MQALDGDPSQLPLEAQLSFTHHDEQSEGCTTILDILDFLFLFGSFHFLWYRRGDNLATNNACSTELLTLVSEEVFFFFGIKESFLILMSVDVTGDI